MIIVYFDLDNTLAAYSTAHGLLVHAHLDYPQSAKLFYSTVEPISDAVTAYKFLELMGFDCRVLTAPSPMNPATYRGKATWVLRHLGQAALNKMIIASDKSLIKGNFLLDDNLNSHGQDKFEGRFIHCPYGETDWKCVIEAITRLPLNKPKVPETPADAGDHVRTAMKTKVLGE
jgi:hypothetical protein